MKIVLVYPPELFSASQVASAVLAPLGISYIAANLIKHGHDVHIIDALGESPEQFVPFGNHRTRGLTIHETVDRIPDDADWIGISSLYSSMWPATLAVIRETKQRFPDVPIVLGGPHPSSYPGMVMSEPAVDYIIHSEGEKSALQFIDALEGRRELHEIDGFVWRHNGNGYRTAKKEYLSAEELDELPMPCRDLLPMENYIRCKESHGANRGRSTTMLASRGCPYKCSFCTTPLLWTTKFRVRSPANVVDEILHLKDTYQVTDIHFVDDNLTVSRRWTQDFARELIDREVDVTWQLSTGVRVETVDRATLELMKASGCSNIAFAPESGNERVLKEVLTKTIKPEKVKEAAQEAIDVGMKVCLFFIAGAPGEAKAEAEDSISFARDVAKLGVDEASFSKFSPLPGTKLFDRLLREGEVRIDREFYESLGYQSELGRARSWNEEMTDEELRRLAQRAFRTFFLTSFISHPFKALRTMTNLLLQRQETKLDRYVQRTFKVVARRLLGRQQQRHAPQNWPEEAASEPAAIVDYPLGADLPTVSLES